jgi:hypothetical protein
MEKLNTRAGLRVTWVDTLLPFGAVKVRDGQSLAALRRLPYIDYIEPTHFATYPMDGSCGSGTSSSSDSPYGEQLLSINGSYGTDYVAHTYEDMGIVRAWTYSQGAGVTIADVGTGLDEDPNSEFGSSVFSSGESGGRWVVRQDIGGADQGVPSCSHDTRISGVMTAPKNGRSIVGIAYRSNLYNVRHSNDYFPTEVSYLALREAGQSGAKVIEIAWGGSSYFMSDEIDYWYYNQDVTFVGAAGTCPFGDSCTDMSSAVFPASKGEVLAVTGAASDGTRPTGMFNYGSKGGVLAYTNIAATGLHTSTIMALGGSSGASAVVAGVAGLIRSHEPWLTNRQVMDRLLNTRGDRCWNPPPQFQNDMINAWAALGGMCVPPGPVGPSQVIFYPGSRVDSVITYSVRVSQGVGPISFRWMTGETTSSIQVHFHPYQAGPLPIQVYADIQDLGTPYPPIRKAASVRVIDNTGSGGGGGTCRPPMLHC